MEILIQRKPADGDALPGDCYISGKLFAFSLERTSKAIPAGRYPVRFTVSDRASRQELWSPDARHRLPLIDHVPGRSGIRIHAANFDYELEGCLALGQRRAGDRLVYSRAAIEPFIDRVTAADAAHEPMWITLVDAGAADPLKMTT